MKVFACDIHGECTIKKKLDGMPTCHRCADRTAPDPVLTIGMATYDDFDGALFSVQALRMYHAEVMPKCEILVVDNGPELPGGPELRDFLHSNNGRYVVHDEVGGTAAPRDAVFRHANGQYVLCMDSHVFLAPGSLKRLIDWYSENSDTSHLYTGPMLGDNLRPYATHMDPVWNDKMFGVWGSDPELHDPNAAPKEIPMHGLGIFTCRKDAWPGFNPEFRGFGGEEGYIHEKFRQRGDTTYCLPFLRWWHRFARPRGVTYRPTLGDRVMNYLKGWKELNLCAQDLINHFAPLVNTPEQPGTMEAMMVVTGHNPADYFNTRATSQSEIASVCE